MENLADALGTEAVPTQLTADGRDVAAIPGWLVVIAAGLPMAVLAAQPAVRKQRRCGPTAHRVIRRVLAGAALAIVLVAGTGAAGAHEVDPSVLTVIDEVTPAVDGLHVEIGTSVTTQLLVANDTGEVLEVLDEGGQPFLRIGPEGVEANLAAPAWYVTNQPLGGGVPPGAGADEPAAVGARVGRAHVGLVRPPPPPHRDRWRPRRRRAPDLRGADAPRRPGPHRPRAPRGTHDGAALRATLRAVPDPATGLVVQLLEGRAPGLFVRYTGTGEAVVVGAEGEPFLRLGPDGAEVNRAARRGCSPRRRGGRTSPASTRTRTPRPNGQSSRRARRTRGSTRAPSSRRPARTQ